ncbi:hypothetical protein [Paenibacillus sp. CF384]|uniref:hypothetical protein n=1 Tax=Paenibacillus sp. CF384 TaxID=1884382 RepID=UPI000898B6F7|nr:hypothetical protein [Paenibacillus sp. CF384]SDW14359.1 hypothetical protein SAMN05518855_1001403 [Paenibacillus sp. CF384]
MPYTTGWVTNTREFGTAASTIVVNIKNNNQTTATSFIVKVYASVDSTSFNHLYSQSINLVPKSSRVATFFIAGNVAYEVQFDEMMPPLIGDTVLTVYGIDEVGQLVTNQRFTPPEFTFINAFSTPF